MFVGTTGIDRVVERTAQLMGEHDTDDVGPHGGDPADDHPEVPELPLQRVARPVRRRDVDERRELLHRRAQGPLAGGAAQRRPPAHRRRDRVVDTVVDGAIGQTEVAALIGAQHRPAARVHHRLRERRQALEPHPRRGRARRSGCTLPHIAFNRKVGAFAGIEVTPGRRGDPGRGVGRSARTSGCRPTSTRRYVRSLMQPVYERGKIAALDRAAAPGHQRQALRLRVRPPPDPPDRARPPPARASSPAQRCAMTTVSSNGCSTPARTCSTGTSSRRRRPARADRRRRRPHLRRAARARRTHRRGPARPRRAARATRPDVHGRLARMRSSCSSRAMRIGAVPVPVSTMLHADDLAELLRDSRARVLAVSPGFAATAEEAAGPRAGARRDRGLRRRRPDGRRCRCTPPPRSKPAEPTGRRVPDHARLPRVLALHLRHDRPAEGRDAPARLDPRGLRDVRRAGARHPAGRPLPVRRRSCSSRTASATRCSSRSSVGASAMLEPAPSDAGS